MMTAVGPEPPCHVCDRRRCECHWERWLACGGDRLCYGFLLRHSRYWLLERESLCSEVLRLLLGCMSLPCLLLLLLLLQLLLL